MLASTAERVPGDVAQVSFREAFSFWLRLGFINFGGPAGQIAIMHRELVEQRRWIGEGAFLRGLNFCTLLPGPEAQQLAAYIGWRLHGIPGGIVAGAFFVIPSVFVLLALSWLAVAHGEVPWVSGLLYGVQPVVIAVVLAAVLRIGKRTLHHPLLVAIAVASFVAIALLRVPFPVVVLAAGLAGLALERRYPGVFRAPGHGSSRETAAVPSDPTGRDHLPGAPDPAGRDESAVAPDPADAERDPEHGDLTPSVRRAARIVLACVALWAVPVGAITLWRGPGDVLVREALFFTQAAFVTFGGAYAVLAYISEQAVNTYRWLGPDEMAQGLGLAESTPGPLIMVTQYVGFVGAWRDAGPYPPLLYGVLGGLITTYVTFLPSFLLIFLGAPHIDALGRDRRIAGALTAITAAVVGVIANLAVFFGGHVLLRDGRLDAFAVTLALAAFVAIQRFRVPIFYAVPAGALVGMAWRLSGPG